MIASLTDLPSPSGRSVERVHAKKGGMNQMGVRILLGALAAATLVLATGCGVGPINDRLYVSEWKPRKHHPIKVYDDFVYPGESYEHAVTVEGD
jgi:hypothetical protein